MMDTESNIDAHNIIFKRAEKLADEILACLEKYRPLEVHFALVLVERFLTSDLEKRYALRELMKQDK